MLGRILVLAFATVVLTILIPVSTLGGVKELFGKSYAVVIGVQDYPTDSGVPILNYPRKDAEGMAAYLRSQGFEVIELSGKKATKANIIRTMEDVLAPQLGSRDRVLFFFSGHGETLELGGESWGYILPYDAKKDSPSTWIGMELIRSLSSKMGNARHQYFIMDACYGGQIGLKASGAHLPASHPDYIREVARRVARQFLTAGGKDQQVRDGGPKGYSYFTGFLLEALIEGYGDLNGDGYITVDELETYLIPRASAWNQTPGRGQFSGHGLGEFLFEVRGASRVPVEVDPDVGAGASDAGFKGGELARLPGLYLRDSYGEGTKAQSYMFEAIDTGDSYDGSYPNNFEEHVKTACFSTDVTPDKRLSWADLATCRGRPSARSTPLEPTPSLASEPRQPD